MSSELSLKEIQKEWHGTFTAYVVGFILCVVLTIVSYFVATGDILQGDHLVYALLTLAIVQAAVQVYFFLHLGKEAKPRWETIIFVFMLLILLIIAIGSLWIMNDLNQRMMPNMSELMTHD
jgi:cytochrome o ubiquinol oxidase operon protein cyoD